MSGEFFWYELITTDLAPATAFYERVVGWRMETGGAPGGPPYTLANVGPRGVAGLMTIPDDIKGKVPPCWSVYVAVDDVDQAVAAITAAGGSLRRGPIEVPNVIHFAVVADPQGAVFLVARPMPPENLPAAPAEGTPGTAGWHELYAADGPAAFGFYEQMFGWAKLDAFDMGPMGTYQLFATHPGGAAVGGMMTKAPHIPHPTWGVYFYVGAIDAAVERVKTAGGQILMGPHEVPTGQWIVQGADPQGANFALIAQTR